VKIGKNNSIFDDNQLLQLFGPFWNDNADFASFLIQFKQPTVWRTLEANGKDAAIAQNGSEGSA
jgi:hypothetical protein